MTSFVALLENIFPAYALGLTTLWRAAYSRRRGNYIAKNFSVPFAHLTLASLPLFFSFFLTSFKCHPLLKRPRKYAWPIRLSALRS